MSDSTECLFCRIRDAQVPASVRHRDEHCYVIEDIRPQAPHHLLVIPNKHLATLNDLTPDDRELVGHLHLVAARLAKELGVHESGYRTVFNTLREAGQTVFHIHLHLLAGRPMSWPPG